MRAAMLVIATVEAGCTSNEYASPVSPVDATTHQFKLANCAAPVNVALPSEFVRAPNVEAEAAKGCHYGSYTEQGRKYECLFIDWDPRGSNQRVQVEAQLNFLRNNEPGNIDAEAWSAMRSSLGGPSSAARDERFANSIRQAEPSAPANVSEVRKRFPQFFHNAADAAASLTISSNEVRGGRYYYTQGCVVHVQFPVAYPSQQPISTINGWLARTAVK